ncbi:hypothetical protein WN51_01728 [Melipona quadrifasciata]|uniref:Uncharacterized protein n=1 Tax=Melipona quadrifasciata TaxID=166423 RepID=A0A0N0BE70_9HYME|nr:hypothetical protein WN51_01728 [Melipona quadrifasciata]
MNERESEYAPSTMIIENSICSTERTGDGDEGLTGRRLRRKEEEKSGGKEADLKQCNFVLRGPFLTTKDKADFFSRSFFFARFGGYLGKSLDSTVASLSVKEQENLIIDAIGNVNIKKEDEEYKSLEISFLHRLRDAEAREAGIALFKNALKRERTLIPRETMKRSLVKTLEPIRLLTMPSMYVYMYFQKFPESTRRAEKHKAAQTSECMFPLSVVAATSRNHRWSRATKSADNLKTIHHWTAYSILRPARDITCRRKLQALACATRGESHVCVTMKMAHVDRKPEGRKRHGKTKGGEENEEKVKSKKKKEKKKKTVRLASRAPSAVDAVEVRIAVGRDGGGGHGNALWVGCAMSGWPRGVGGERNRGIGGGRVAAEAARLARRISFGENLASYSGALDMPERVSIGLKNFSWFKRNGDFNLFDAWFIVHDMESKTDVADWRPLPPLS